MADNDKVKGMAKGVGGWHRVENKNIGGGGQGLRIQGPERLIGTEPSRHFQTGGIGDKQ